MNELFIKQFFSEKGELSQSIEDYRLRQEQVDISVLIDEAITNKKKLIVEAGTGIGKTFAYLVPAFLSGGKIIISTATKNLQDQLFTKDIPMIRDALNVPVTLAMLKGRSNYLCHLRLENAMIEGAFMTKYNGKYYLQYGAPGTEFSGYADGVYVGSGPLGPFEYQSHNPFSYKPGGFARGAGHGATFTDAFEQYWHVSTIGICVKNNFERRLGIWPAGFDKDDILYSNTAYGDYPTYLPSEKRDHLSGSFTGWMLLNYNKPIQVSSTLGGFQPNLAVDEDIKTYWSAKTANKGEYLISDLGELSTINAIQINYADQDAELMGKPYTTTGHKYILYTSNDGKNWKVLVDKSKSTKDVPHEYIELATPVKARFLKLENVAMPTGKFAISGFRVFGTGSGENPGAVKNFVPLRSGPKVKGERRNVWFKWQQEPNADGYVIYFGKSPDKLYGSIMVYGKTEYYFNGLDRSDIYFFQIEAFNNNGIGPRSDIKKAE